MHPTLSLGQPTTQEKAKLFIKSLDLGLTAIPRPSTISPTHKTTTLGNRNLTIIPMNKTVSLTHKKRVLPDYCPSTVQKICSNTQSKARNISSYSYDQIEWSLVIRKIRRLL